MILTWLLVLGGILFFGLILAGFVFLIVRLSAGAISQASGWKALAMRYPAQYAPAGIERNYQTIRFNNATRFRLSTRIIVSAQGLYLEQQVLVSHPPMLIPWREIHPAGETIIYWRKAQVLSIGSPPMATLAVFPDIYSLALPYIQNQ